MKLIIMRGVSGSGKSTLAREITATLPAAAVIYSTDDFFVGENGGYCFEPSRLGEYHAANVQRVVAAMAARSATVVVDNTNCRAWEMQPYVAAADLYGYAIEVVEAPAISFQELMSRQARRADQGKALGAEVVKRMLTAYEPGVTLEVIRDSKRPF